MHIAAELRLGLGLLGLGLWLMLAYFRDLGLGLCNDKWTLKLRL